MMIGAYLSINGKITVGSMIASVQLMNYIMNPIVEISNELSKIKSVKLIYKALTDGLNNNTYDGKLEKKIFNCCIEFKNLKFSYDNQKQILNNINLKFKKNKKYAIVGESGSGKSTLTKLILNYYKNYEGHIYIDNVELKEIRNKFLYKIITIIHQNVFMFDGTVKENIDLYQGYSEESINRAIDLSGLNKIIEKLSNGVDTNICENGFNFSGGEKQRISIARALVKETPILILDEATSSLDNRTSYEIEKSILRLNNITALVVTHKLSKELLCMYDEIIVLKNGEVIEKGDFETLINKQGYFCELFNIGI